MSHRIIIADNFEEAMKLLKDHVSKESLKQQGECIGRPEPLKDKSNPVPVRAFNFSEALERIKKDQKVTRLGNPPQTHFQIIARSIYDEPHKSHYITPYLAKVNDYTSSVWTPSHEDLLAEDWIEC